VTSPYLTTAEVADLVRTSAETVRYWRFVGKGPASFKLGRKVLYDRAEVEAWIASERTAQTAPAVSPAGR
jgi:excisionase family DNA binding protein